MADPFLLQPPRAVYLHVPFCRHRCGYCDFTLVAKREDLIAKYLQALARDLQTLGEPRPVDTLFLGGGTPTHLSVDELGELLGLVHEWFSFREGCEFSVEANPAGLSDDKVNVLADAGVNRISLGAQSFDSDVLAFLERDHSPAEIASAVHAIKQRIDNLSLDLIFGVPGQSLASWQETLHAAISLSPTHVSTYGLTFEKGTAFWTRREKGLIKQSPEDLEREMYAAAMEELSAAGFKQYEISNFAKPGFECRHNQVYWKAEPYFGFGPGAARYRNGRREMSHKSVTTWIKRVLGDQSPIMDFEELSNEDRARELCVLGLRMTAGIDKNAFKQRTGYVVEDLASESISKHLAAGLLENTRTHLRLTKAGRFVADSVVSDFL